MAQLPPGRNPIDDQWLAKTAKMLEQEMAAIVRSRDFPNNTCPASRHVQVMAESLIEQGSYPLLSEDPRHCAGSMLSVLNSLYSARTFLQQLGYTWETDEDGNVKWRSQHNY